MAGVSLSDENRVAIPLTVLEQIEDLYPEQAEHVQTQLLEITEAGYTPEKLVYKQYGDLKVFRCGDEMRIFGVILENLAYLEEFDHLVLVIHVSEHDYDRAGVQRKQAQRLQQKYSSIDSREDFYEKLDGVLLDSKDLSGLI